jgi:peptidoglycan/LPS O-acetylase OafA/YrhL
MDSEKGAGPLPLDSIPKANLAVYSEESTDPDVPASNATDSTIQDCLPPGNKNKVEPTTISLGVKAGTFYRPELDVVRFCAFFFVCFDHIFPHSAEDYTAWTKDPRLQRVLADTAVAGAFGMCLFFVLSAYLIATLLLREKDSTGTIRMRSFYERRILRIWPLYFFALSLGFLYGITHRNAYPAGLFSAYLLLVGNWYTSVHGFAFRGIGHLWSISLEEQFYLLFPVTVLFLTRKQLILLVLFLIGFANLTLLVIANFNINQDHGAWSNTFVQFYMFAAGIGIALWTHSRGLPKLRRTTRICMVIAGPILGILAQAEFHFKGAENTASAAGLVAGYTLVAIACSLFLVGGLGYSGRIPSFLIYLGKVSYGLYVYHVWALILAAYLIHKVHPLGNGGGNHPTEIILLFVFTLIFATIASSTSYSFLEKPFLKLKERLAVVHSRPV